MRGRRPAARRSGGGRSRRSSAAARAGGARTPCRRRAEPSCRSLPRGRGTGTRRGRARCAGPRRGAHGPPGACRCGAPGRRGTPRPAPARARRDRLPPTSRTQRDDRGASGPSVAMRSDQATRLRDAEQRERDLGATRRRADPCGRREHEPAHRVRLQHRGAQPDDTAERVPDPDGAGQLLGANDPSTASASASTSRASGRRPERPWPGRSGTSTRCLAASRGASDRQFSIVPPRPCTSTSGGPPRRRAADRIAKPSSAPVELALLESAAVRCLPSVTSEAYSSFDGCLRRADRVMSAKSTSEGAT